MTFDQIIYIAIVIYSIILHEIAHGYMAKVLGDDTADRAGRLTLNPVPHVDPIGSLLLPIMSVMQGWGVFGYAKGVPINLNNLNKWWKELLVSAAGIMMNIFLSSVFLLLVKFDIGGEVYRELFVKIALVNFGLALFNLIPVPPFDGLQILRSIIPALKHKFEFVEHNPLFLIGAILVASQIFSYMYKPVFAIFVKLFI